MFPILFSLLGQELDQALSQEFDALSRQDQTAFVYRQHLQKFLKIGFLAFLAHRLSIVGSVLAGLCWHVQAEFVELEGVKCEIGC